MTTSDYYAAMRARIKWRRPWTLSYHESFHATTAFEFGLPVYQVTIARADAEGYDGLTTHADDSHLSLVKRGAINAASIAGWNLAKLGEVLGVPYSAYGAEHDEIAWRRICYLDREYYEAYDLAESIIAERWLNWRALAQALVSKRTLGRDEIESALNGR